MLGNITDPKTGKPVQLGAFRKRVVDETFLGSVPPLLVTAGTVTHSTMPSSVGYIEVATSDVVGNAASINTSFMLPMGQLEAIEFTIEGFRLTKSQPNALVQFSLRATGDHGVNLIQNKAATTAYIQHRNPAANPAKDSIAYDIISAPAQAQKRRSLTWRLLPQLKEAHLYEFDTLIASIQLDSTNATNVTASISVTTNEAVSHAFQLETFKIYTEHN